ncbi:uncharacterized protein [Lolium perenne]|uniref:uncharacterized protein n=1 Tax=Lolium perenne TaxID=4522 RepID=UPI0021EAEFDE|nr:uncharacterized protein LOC127316754 [Lolium perenne]
MERHDYFLLVTTATCAALAVASFLILIVPSPHYVIPVELFQFMVASTGAQMMWCLMAIPVHICILLGWTAPQELFSYKSVVIHWILTAESLVWASVGVGLVHSQHFARSSCAGLSGAVCRTRWELSSWLALVMAALSIVDALVLRWATSHTHGAAQACSV